MWRQSMGLSSYAHRGWLPWFHQLNNNIIHDQAWSNEQGQMEGHAAASSSSGKGSQLDLVQSEKEYHSLTQSPSVLSPSLPPPPPPPPQPKPLHPPPPNPFPTTTTTTTTTSIPKAPWVHTEQPSALAIPSDNTRWLKLLVVPEYGIPPVAAETT